MCFCVVQVQLHVQYVTQAAVLVRTINQPMKYRVQYTMPVGALKDPAPTLNPSRRCTGVESSPWPLIWSLEQAGAWTPIQQHRTQGGLPPVGLRQVQRTCSIHLTSVDSPKYARRRYTKYTIKVVCMATQATKALLARNPSADRDPVGSGKSLAAPDSLLPLSAIACALNS